MSLLLRNYKVHTRYGGGFVQSIDGLAGGEAGGQPGRLVLLRQRRRGHEGRGGDRRARGRPHLVGPPRLERDRGRAGGRRLLPGAVPARHRRQAPAGARRMRARRRAAPAAPSRRACAALGVPAAIARARRGRRAADAARARRPLARNCAPNAQLQPLEQRPARERRLRDAPNAAGTTLDAARPGRRAVRTLGAGAGLIAATAGQETRPIWVVTGHRRGRRRAAAAQALERSRAARTASPSPSRPPAPAAAGARRERARRSDADRLPPPRQPAARRPRARSRRPTAARSRSRRCSLDNPLAARRAARGRARCAAAAAGVGRQLLRAARASGAAAARCRRVLVNVLVSRDGLTVFARLGDWGVLGQVDLTLEALVYGLVFGAAPARRRARLPAGRLRRRPRRAAAARCGASRSARR